ncbi:MAG: HNH endonuclease, partial [Clostridia bacterium]|nr:HNH endonuclease [Clostridia bacterium]
HMISFKNGAALDNMANFVKLCPTCHGKLGKGSATKEQQIQAITKILHEHQEVFEFTSSYLAIDDINKLSEKIWELLG